MTPTPHQLEQLHRATSRGNVGLLLGSPGTGKTFVAAHFVSAQAERIGYTKICAVAQTGKASVRLTDSFQANGVPLRAKTIHSTLKVSSSDRNDGWAFEHGRHNPLPYSLIVVDESSMIDTSLMASLFAARPRGCRMLLLGDTNQLPPVGHGRPLYDMIAAGVPFGELTEIHRNAGGIVQACKDMKEGRRFECGGNLHHLDERTPEGIRRRTLALLAELERGGLDPAWDCQVVVAVNRKSPLSRRDINQELQRQLNTAEPVPHSPFRLGDKVVCLRNGYYPPANVDGYQEQLPDDSESCETTTNERGEIYVANGNIGRVVVAEPRYMEVQLSAPTRFVRIPRGQQEESENGDGEGGEGNDSDSGQKGIGGCSWDLAYALSCHKMQGDEIPVIIPMVDEFTGARRLYSKEYWITAISRGKSDCYLVGDIETVHATSRHEAIKKRRTFLKELIRERLALHGV